MPKWDGDFTTTGVMDYVVKAYQPYKFVVAFENSQVPGYITEKVMNVRLANAVPIYWGEPELDQYLNVQAVVWCKEDISGIDLSQYELGGATYAIQDFIKAIRPNLFQDCIKEIERLDQDPQAYADKLAQPLFLPHQEFYMKTEVYDLETCSLYS